MERYYQNPIKINGDFADPYVIRFNGRYYLFCTNPDIRCWSSVDLCDWKPEGPAIEDGTFGDLVPFAPEVVYHNGMFYMYTSPSGHGHYVLESSSPTGPYRRITANIGHAIDGSVFIDDDGQWYFYWAGDEGIWACKMDSPITFGEPVLTGAYMHGWTEGPFVMKRNGRYYMTYTGNHYLSKGYRVNAAVSDDPLRGFIDDTGNPILVRTEGPAVGLGHSCNVLGPDLKSYYIIYHNLNPDQSRDLNIDRICWDRDNTLILGPSPEPQRAPKLPDFQSFCDSAESLAEMEVMEGTVSFSDGYLQSGEGAFLSLARFETADDAVLEINLKSQPLMCESSCYGAVFGWRSDDDYFRVAFYRGGREAAIIHCHKGGEIVLMKTSLPKDYDECSLHCLRIGINKGNISLYIDGRYCGTAETDYSCSGRAGVFSENGSISVGAVTISQGSEKDEEEAAISEYTRLKSRIHCVPQSYSLESFNSGSAYEKVVFGHTRGDMTAEAFIRVTPTEPGGMGGLLLRASELSDGGEGGDPVLGTNFFIGYFVGLCGDKLVLSKHRYDEQILGSVEGKWDLRKEHRIRVEMKGGCLKIYADDTKRALIQYEDTAQITCGKVGVRTKGSIIHVRELRVS